MEVYRFERGKPPLVPCLVGAVPATLVNGALLYGILSFQYGSLYPRRFMGPILAMIYAYHGTICPLQSISGRPSAWHNFISGAAVGAAGISRGYMGVPLVHYYLRYPQVPRAAFGGAVYGGFAFFFALLGGKRL